MVMKMTSAESAKLLKKIQSEYETLKTKERLASSFLASVGEDPETVRPKYNYEETKTALHEFESKIRKLKHAINLFNVTTVIPEYNITVDEMLVLIPQLSNEKRKLEEMASRLPKAREQSFGRINNIIDYRYANYNIEATNADMLNITDELSKAQLALDEINHSLTLEVDI